jgi:hypothetical protein
MRRHAALFFAVLYLVLMPAFATAFSLLPHGSFYDSNAHREQGAYSDAARLRNRLSVVVQHRLRQLSWKVHGFEAILHKPTVKVTSLEYSSGQDLLMEVAGLFAGGGHSELVSGNFGIWVQPDLRELPLVFHRQDRAPTYVVPVDLTLQGGDSREYPRGSPIAPPVSLLFPPLRSALPTPPSTAGTLILSQPRYEELMEFYLEVDGDPSYTSGLWLRMLYLSVVTITTLGFGDITPVSELARTLITAEAIAGVIVVGLFLLALAHQFSESRRRI